MPFDHRLVDIGRSVSISEVTEHEFVAFEGRRRLRRCPPGTNYEPPLSCESIGGGAPDARRRAGNDGDLAGETPVAGGRCRPRPVEVHRHAGTDGSRSSFVQMPVASTTIPAAIVPRTVDTPTTSSPRSTRPVTPASSYVLTPDRRSASARSARRRDGVGRFDLGDEEAHLLVIDGHVRLEMTKLGGIHHSRL